MHVCNKITRTCVFILHSPLHYALDACLILKILMLWKHIIHDKLGMVRWRRIGPPPQRDKAGLSGISRKHEYRCSEKQDRQIYLGLADFSG